jgi:hypothetical protein
MLSLWICSLKSTVMRGIKILPSSRASLGFEPKFANRRQNPAFEGSDQAQRCTRHLSMISSKKIEHKCFRIDETIHTQKSHKKTRKSVCVSSLCLSNIYFPWSFWRISIIPVDLSLNLTIFRMYIWLGLFLLTKLHISLPWWDECFHELLQENFTYVRYTSFWKFLHEIR